MPTRKKKPATRKPANNTKFKVSVHKSACLEVGDAIDNIPDNPRYANRDSDTCVDSTMSKLYIDYAGDLVAEAECGQKCLVARSEAQITQIRDFLTSIIDAK